MRYWDSIEHITDFEIFVVPNQPPGFGGRYFVFTKLITGTGIVGYGEIYAATFGSHAIKAMAKDMAERYFVGADPMELESLFHRVYGSGYIARAPAPISIPTQAKSIPMNRTLFTYTSILIWQRREPRNTLNRALPL